MAALVSRTVMLRLTPRRLCHVASFSAQAARHKSQHSLPAAYYRGGTSRGVVFHRDVLPAEQTQWNAIFLGCLGSPDPYGRQLDGLGGGISSLSKVCIVGPPTRSDADVDYTFVAIGIRDRSVDYSSNCGNMSAAIGPYAVNAGLLPTPTTPSATVRIHNTNTGKLIHATFPVVDGEAAVSGEFSMDGVAGTAAPVRLAFVRPAGSRTGLLLPTGHHTDTIDGMPVTLLDAGNPCCFVQAAALGVSGTLAPAQITAHPQLPAALESVRRQAGVLMGLAATPEDVPGSVPKIAMVSAPTAGAPDAASVVVRAISVGQPHNAVPVTVAIATAAAARLPGTTVAECVVAGGPSADADRLDIQHPTGRVTVDATYDAAGELAEVTIFRTARRLMEGAVFWK